MYFFEKINFLNLHFFLTLLFKSFFNLNRINIYIGEINPRTFQILKKFNKNINILDFKFDEIKKNNEFAPVFLFNEISNFGTAVFNKYKFDKIFSNSEEFKIFNLFFFKTLTKSNISNSNFKRLVFINYLSKVYNEKFNKAGIINYIPSDLYWDDIYAEISKQNKIHYHIFKDKKIINILFFLGYQSYLKYYKLKILIKNIFINKKEIISKSKIYLLSYYLGNINLQDQLKFSDIPFAHFDKDIVYNSLFYTIDKIHNNFYISDYKDIKKYNINVLSLYKPSDKLNLNMINESLNNLKINLKNNNIYYNSKYHFLFFKNFLLYILMKSRFEQILKSYKATPIFYSQYIWGLDNLVVNSLIAKINGISTMAQMSYEHFHLEDSIIKSDIYFIFSKNSFQQQILGKSKINYYIIVGYLGDYRFKIKDEDMLLHKKKLINKNVKKIISFFDENSSEYEKFQTGKTRYIKLHEEILKNLISNKDIAIIFKPKRITNFYKYMKKIKLFEQAKDTGRLLVLGSETNSMPPSEVVKISDYVVHLDFHSATAGVESILCEKITFFLNDHGYQKGYFYEYGKNKFIFNNINDIFREIINLSNNTIKFNEFYNNDFLDFLDPYRDSRANIRISEYINELRINLNKGYDKNISIQNTNNKFIQKWGQDKIIINEKL